MPATLTLEAIGSNGEQLAMQAGEALDVPVGIDPEFQCATFDSDSHDDEDHLESAVFEALAGIDPDWETHLRVAE